MYRKNGGGESRDPDDYFRLNVWGMGDARQALFQIGIVRLADMPPFPKAEDYGLDEYPDDDDNPASDDERRYLEAVRQWKESPHGEGPGIPLYKFGSNDGWLVLPIEVQSGVRYADEHHPGWRDGLEDFVREFVVWMEGSTEGFEVW